jgi:hypothetical protein
MWLIELAVVAISLPLFVFTGGQAFKKRFKEHKLAHFLLGVVAIVSSYFLTVELWRAYQSYWAVQPPAKASGPSAQEQFTRAVELANRGQNADAIRIFTALIEAGDGNIEAYARRGRAYAALGLDDQAIQDFDSVISMSPGSSEIGAERRRLVERRQAETLAPLWNDIDSRGDYSVAANETY